MERFQFERALLEDGVRTIAGLDEAGRGPLAGPVVAAAAVLPRAWVNGELPPALRGLNDSKQLTSAQREGFFLALTTSSDVRYAVGIADVAEIDSLNILRATHHAMNQALSQLQPEPDHVLVDGLPVATLRFVQTAIVGGDARSYSIAAASVIAKVTRDRWMVEYDQRFPEYGFARNKGYGTPEHLAALEQHGPCALHRRTFAPIRLKQPELFSI